MTPEPSRQEQRAERAEAALKPCPFCGHDWPLLTKHSNEAYTEYSVRCYQGCCSTRADELKDEAVHYWNTRATLNDAGGNEDA